MDREFIDFAGSTGNIRRTFEAARLNEKARRHTLAAERIGFGVRLVAAAFLASLFSLAASLGVAMIAAMATHSPDAMVTARNWGFFVFGIPLLLFFFRGRHAHANTAKADFAQFCLDHHAECGFATPEEMVCALKAQENAYADFMVEVAAKAKAEADVEEARVRRTTRELTAFYDAARRSCDTQA